MNAGNPFKFTAHSVADTDRLGAALAAALPDNAVVSLTGELGAGKTRLVKAIAIACGVPEADVISPTFVLCREYHGRRRIIHIDAYRLADADEFLALGPEEWFEGGGLTLIEWGEKVTPALPAERYDIHVSHAPELSADTRRFAISTPPGGPRLQDELA